MAKNPPEWTKKYMDRQWEPPFGCFMLIAEVLEKEFDCDVAWEYKDELNPNTDTFHSRASIIMQAMQESCIATISPKPGDLVVVTAGSRPIHIGIVVETNWMLHCDVGVNTLLTRLDDIVYKNRIDGYYRVIKPK